MVLRLLCLLVLLLATSACPGMRGAPHFGNLRAEPRPFTLRHDIALFTLDNGMTVALVPDRRTNLVTVDARYTVGASADPSGRAGLAHLVEHLTFEARMGADGASLADRLGEAALHYNAFTNHDVTHYTATALAERLPDMLELEARRLELTCEQLGDDVFAREREVVLAETSQRRSAWSDLLRELRPVVWGKHHPYARETGTREVVDATRDEVCRFVGGHYAPDRLMLVVTGDFATDPVAEAIRERFARVTRKSSLPPVAVPGARLTGTLSRHRADINDATALVFFAAPSWGGDDAVPHALALQRLQQVLSQAGEAHAWIRGVSVSTMGAGQARLALVRISVDDASRLGAAADELFARIPSMFTDISPYQTSRLLGQLQTSYVASYESFSERGSWLANYLTYTYHDTFMVPELEALSRTSIPDVERYALAHFTRARSHIALVEPNGQGKEAVRVAETAERELDLAPWRAPVDPLDALRPLPTPVRRLGEKREELLLDNGLRVLLAPEPTRSMVDVRLMFPHGWASDPAGRLGRAHAAAVLLEPNPDRLYRAGDRFLLGWGLSLATQLDVNVHETATVFTASGASNDADWHVWRLLWRIRQCVYLNDSVKTYRDGLMRASAHGIDSAMDLSRQLLFGAAHPYAAPSPRGSDWGWLTPAELEGYYQTHYVPRGATLIVTGGFDVEAMREHVRTLFSPWSDASARPPTKVPAIQPVPGPHWIGTREAARSQVGLRVTFATASEPERDQAARWVLREMVGDRLRIIREGTGASYGVQVDYNARTGGGTFEIESELEPAKAAKAAAAIVSELEALRTGAGSLAEDFVRARRRALASALAETSGASDVADEIEYGLRQGLPADYIDQLALALSRVTPAQVAAVAAVDLAPSRRVVQVTATPERVDLVLKQLNATGPRLFDQDPGGRPERVSGPPSP